MQNLSKQEATSKSIENDIDSKPTAVKINPTVNYNSSSKVEYKPVVNSVISSNYDRPLPVPERDSVSRGSLSSQCSNDSVISTTSTMNSFARGWNVTATKNNSYGAFKSVRAPQDR